mgnify:CR=1 FL=1
MPKTPGNDDAFKVSDPARVSHSLSQIDRATPYRGRDTSPTHPFPGVVGAMPLDTRAKQRAPLPGCHPPTVLSFGRIGWRDRHPVCILRPSLPADPAGAKPRRDHRFLDRVSRHEVPKTPGYLRRLLNIRPRQGSHSLSQIDSATPYRGRDTSPTHPFPRVVGATPLDPGLKSEHPYRGATRRCSFLSVPLCLDPPPCSISGGALLGRCKGMRSPPQTRRLVLFLTQ